MRSLILRCQEWAKQRAFNNGHCLRREKEQEENGNKKMGNIQNDEKEKKLGKKYKHIHKLPKNRGN